MASEWIERKRGQRPRSEWCQAACCEAVRCWFAVGMNYCVDRTLKSNVCRLDPGGLHSPVQYALVNLFTFVIVSVVRTRLYTNCAVCWQGVHVCTRSPGTNVPTIDASPLIPRSTDGRRKKDAREVHKRSEFAQKVHGIRAKLYQRKRFKEKATMRKT